MDPLVTLVLLEKKVLQVQRVIRVIRVILEYKVTQVLKGKMERVHLH